MRTVIPATGDSVGNHGEVAVQIGLDGTLSILARHRTEATQVFLTREQGAAVAAALLHPFRAEPVE